MKRELVKTKLNSKKRLGRGYGSGKGGHTAGRGQKGQKSRNNLGILFEGIKVRKSFLKRTPQLRGKDKFKPRKKAETVDVSELAKFPSGSKIDKSFLIKQEVVSSKASAVKVLGGGELNKKLTVALPVSGTAQKKIEKAGGKVEKNV